MQTFFSRSPWERSSMAPFRGSALGQTSPNCEPTPEGGQRCADGTYYPPGCKPGSGSGIPAAAPTPGANVPLIIGGVAAAAAAGYLLLSGHKHRMAAEPTALEASYPEAISQLTSIADKINSERANDAFFFSKYIDASKRRQDLVIAEGNAQKVLAQQEKIWNDTHRNPDEYQAAQAALDQIGANKAAAAQEMQENRDGINQAAQNIMTLRSNAEAIVSQLPAEVQAEAWRIIDPCSFRKPTMEGRRLGQFYSWNSAGDQSGHNPYANPYAMTPEQRLLQAAQESMNQPPPETPEQRLLRTNGLNPQLTQASYTCSYGDDVRRGVDSTTMAILRAQGYTCRQDSSGFENISSYGGSSSMVAVNPGGGSGAMMGRRYPVINSR